MIQYYNQVWQKKIVVSYVMIFLSKKITINDMMIISTRFIGWNSFKKALFPFKPQYFKELKVLNLTPPP